MATRPPKLRCAVYTRKSTEEGLDQAFNSLDAQREACCAYVLSQQHEGWTLVPEFYDDGGYSGGTMDRPGLKQLLLDVKAGKVNVVVVYKIDRLTRSLADFAKIVEVLDAASASFVSVTQAFNTTTSMGRLTLNVLLSFAQFEREVIAERIRDKIAASKARGMWMGGPVPLGYRVDNRKLVIVEEEAETVREIMRRYLDANSVQTLLSDLARDGIVSKRIVTKSGRVNGGVPFRRGALFWLLSNPIYLGKIRHRDQVYEGEHPAAVEAELFDEVQAKLAANRSKPRINSDLLAKSPRTPTTSRRVASLLAGMIFDGHGRPMSPSHARRQNREYRYYVSSTAQDRSAPAQRLPAAELETAVRNALVEFLRDQGRRFELGPHLDVEQTGTLLTESASIASTIGSAFAAELRSLLQALSMRVAVGLDMATISFSSSALLKLLGLPEPHQDQRVRLELATYKSTYGHEARLRLEPPAGPIPKQDPKLLMLIARGFAARDRLMAMSEEDRLAERHGAHRHLERSARLAYLDPTIVRDILAGTQPRHLTTRALWLTAQLPYSWAEQRRVLRFTAA